MCYYILFFYNFFKEIIKLGGKEYYLQQDTVCLEQPIYPSPENVTKWLVVIVVTFTLSAVLLQNISIKRGT